LLVEGSSEGLSPILGEATKPQNGGRCTSCPFPAGRKESPGPCVPVLGPTHEKWAQSNQAFFLPFLLPECGRKVLGKLGQQWSGPRISAGGCPGHTMDPILP